MDLEKYVSSKDTRLKKYFHLFNRLEPTLEYDDHLADMSFESVSLTSKPEADPSMANTTEKAEELPSTGSKHVWIRENTQGNGSQ